MDQLLPPGWEDLSAKGLVALFVLLIFLGWLIPKRIQDKRDAEKDATIEFQRKTIERLTRATQDFAVSVQTSAHAFRAIEKQAAKADEASDDVAPS